MTSLRRQLSSALLFRTSGWGVSPPSKTSSNHFLCSLASDKARPIFHFFPSICLYGLQRGRGGFYASGSLLYIGEGGSSIYRGAMSLLGSTAPREILPTIQNPVCPNTDKSRIDRTTLFVRMSLTGDGGISVRR